MATFPAGTTAYSYIRMSTQRQLRGDSLLRQTQLSDEFIRKHGLILDKTLHDIGQSAWTGANLKKGALGKFLALVEDGTIAPGSVLLVEALDRLSRQTVINALEPFLALLRAGIIIVTLKDDNIYSQESVGNDWTRLIISLSEMAAANKESENKSGRVRAAAETKRQNGLKGIGKYSQNVPGWIGQDKAHDGTIKYVLNDHATTVKDIFELAADGIGQMGIAKMLNQRNAPTFRKSATGWHQTTVRNVLLNKAVLGILEPRKLVAGKMTRYGDDVPDYYPVAIDEDLFYRVQQMLVRRGPRVRRGNTFTNIFQGLSHCAHCFGPMSVTSGGPKPYTTYLRCYNHFRNKGCDAGKKMWAYGKIEPVVLDTISDFGLSDFAQRRDRKPDLLAVEKEVRDLEATISTAKTNQQALMDQLLTASDKLIPIYQERIEKLLDEENAAQSLLEKAKRKKLAMDGEYNDTSNADEMIKAERLLWPDMDDEQLSRSRSKVHVALKQVYEMMTFDSESELIMLWAANGMKAYRFKDYQLLDKYDAMIDGTKGDGALRPEHFLDGITDPTALADRKELIRRHILATNVAKAGATNPRLNDPYVIALKERRRRGDLPDYHPDKKPHSK